MLIQTRLHHHHLHFYSSLQHRPNAQQSILTATSPQANQGQERATLAARSCIAATDALLLLLDVVAGTCCNCSAATAAKCHGLMSSWM